MLRRTLLLGLLIVLIGTAGLYGQGVSRGDVVMRRVAREWATTATKTAFPTPGRIPRTGYVLHGDSIHFCPGPRSPLNPPAVYDFSAELYDPEGTLFFDKRFSFPLYCTPRTGTEPKDAIQIFLERTPVQPRRPGVSDKSSHRSS